MYKGSLAAMMLAAVSLTAAPAALRAQTKAKPKTHAQKTSAAPASRTSGESEASDDTADRVHAWVAQRQQEQASAAAVADSTPAATKGGKPAAKNTSTPVKTKAAAATAAAKRPAAPTPAPAKSTDDASDTAAGKATAADFDKALAGRNAAPPATSAPAPAPAKKPTTRKPIADEVPVVIKPTVIPQAKLTYRHGRLIMPVALRGSHEILVHQNQMADREGLDRIQDSDDLEAMREKRLLLALPVSAGLRVDPRLPSDRRYARPWAVKFLNDIAHAHAAKFRSALQVNSAVRTVDFQTRLLTYNGNAAPADGEDASPHLTGQAIDLAKRGLSKTEIAWMRAYLAPLIDAGKIDVEEEFQQACFHISVYRSYAPAPLERKLPKRQIAKDNQRPLPMRGAAASLAAVVQ